VPKGAPSFDHGEELAWFDPHDFELEAKNTWTFEDWYGQFDW
jgi:hypothetical protein